MYNDLYKQPGDPIRASDWNALLSLISEQKTATSLPFSSRNAKPFAAKTSSVGAGFSLRSVTKVSEYHLAHFNPGCVHLMSGTGTVRLVPTIDGVAMDANPYPSLSAVSGPLFLVLVSDSSQQVTGALITQNAAESGSKIQIGSFISIAGALRYYPSHVGDVFVNSTEPAKVDVAGQPVGGSGQPSGANIMIAATDTDQVRGRTISSTAGAMAVETYNMLYINSNKAIPDDSTATNIPLMVPVQIRVPTVSGGSTGQAGAEWTRLSDSPRIYGMRMRGLIGGTGISVTYDTTQRCNVISATGGGGGTTYTFNPTNFYTQGQNVDFKLPVQHANNTGSWYDVQKLRVEAPLTLSDTVEGLDGVAILGIEEGALGGTYPTPIAGEGIQINWAADGSDYTISATGGSGGSGGDWPGMEVTSSGDISNGDTYGGGLVKRVLFDPASFNVETKEGETLGDCAVVKVAIGVQNGGADNSVGAFSFPYEYFDVEWEMWNGVTPMAKIVPKALSDGNGGTTGGGTTTGYTGEIDIPAHAIDGGSSSHYKMLDYQDGLLKRVSQDTPIGYLPQW